MCEISDNINEFVSTQIPSLFEDLARYELQVMRSTASQGAGGGQITSAESAVNVTPIKATLSVRNKEEKDEKSGKIVSITAYKISFPVTFTVNSSDRLKILANGLEPLRVFKIIGLAITGGLYKAKCELDK